MSEPYYSQRARAVFASLSESFFMFFMFLFSSFMFVFVIWDWGVPNKFD